ncbi:ABC transporter permease [Pseudoruegeria sp. HB172150]|uniref:ABC transporter permease n=1 Tax=Pseudoruegeria sp. HB172150 TaxID=2721164 RepID=UPI001555EEB1|nr:ABC transporter permease [Pseudoruegeria sp. HB172150]
MKRNGRTVLIALEIATPFVLVTLYALWAAPRDSFFFPPLGEILAALRADWFGERILSDIWPSIRRILLGFSLSAILAVGLGFALGLSRRARIATAPLVEFFRALPPPALLPLTILVLGVGDVAKVLLIALVCLFPILQNTIAGITGIDPTLRETARMYGITRRGELLHVVLPGALPAIFAGLRTSLSLAVIMMVISEFVAASNGIGFGIWQAKRLFDIPLMWSGIIILGILGYILNMALLQIESRVLAWHRGARKAAE